MPTQLIGFLGILVLLLIAYIFSRDRKAIQWKYVLYGFVVQVIFAVGILGIPALQVPGVFRFVFEALTIAMTGLVDFSNAGGKFVFGPLAEIRDPWGFVFVFRVLPTIIFFSSITSALYYLGILQKVVQAFAFVMQKTMKTSGAETLSGAANIFLGQTEAPLLIKPFIRKMTPSEIYCVMVTGMATIAAGVEGAYIGLLKDRVGDIAGHLITASVMSAMGGLIVAKIIFPETGTPQTSGSLSFDDQKQPAANVIEAIAHGASEGIMLALNVAAMLIAFIALIAIFDAGLGKVGLWLNLTEPLSFSVIIGFICRPLAWLMGVPWAETGFVGQLLGEKVVLNEFVSYVHLAEMGNKLSDRSVLIASYALCGFANFASIGIQIGGIGGIAPEQKPTMAKLGLLAVLGGNIACFLSACLAGILF